MLPPNRSRVASVIHPKVTAAGSGKDNADIDGQLAAEMLDRAVMAFAATGSLADAWRKIIPDPRKKVAIKINCQIQGIYTKSKVVQPLVEGLLLRGVKAEDILIYDMTDKAFALAGFVKNLGPQGIKVGQVEDFGGYARFGFDRLAHLLIGGHEKTYRNYVENWLKASAVGPIRAIGRWLLRGVAAPYNCEYLINVPVLKALDGYSGVTLSMKNHYGSFGNPSEHHQDIMDWIPYINSRPQIRAKTRLIVLDALFVQYKWTNGRNQQYVDRQNQLLVSDDPVAIDYLGWQLIEKKRQEHGLARVCPEPIFIAKAASMGLGNNKPNTIDLVDVEL